MLVSIRRTLTAAVAVTALGLAGAAPSALARHGADDPAGHRASDDSATSTHHQTKHRHHHHHHHHHGGGNDGANHT